MTNASRGTAQVQLTAKQVACSSSVPEGTMPQLRNVANFRIP
jgi:hypothetical protein